MEWLTELSILAEAGRRASDQSVHIQRHEFRKLLELPGETEAPGGRSLRLQVTYLLIFLNIFSLAKFFLTFLISSFILELIFMNRDEKKEIIIHAFCI